jgi:hypothetical protein
MPVQRRVSDEYCDQRGQRRFVGTLTWTLSGFSQDREVEDCDAYISDFFNFHLSHISHDSGPYGHLLKRTRLALFCATSRAPEDLPPLIVRSWPPTFRLVASMRASALSSLTLNHTTGLGLRWKYPVISAHSPILKTDTSIIVFSFPRPFRVLVFLVYLYSRKLLRD